MSERLRGRLIEVDPLTSAGRPVNGHPKGKLYRELVFHDAEANRARQMRLEELRLRRS